MLEFTCYLKRLCVGREPQWKKKWVDQSVHEGGKNLVSLFWGKKKGQNSVLLKCQVTEEKEKMFSRRHPETRGCGCCEQKRYGLNAMFRFLVDMVFTRDSAWRPRPDALLEPHKKFRGMRTAPRANPSRDEEGVGEVEN